MKEGEELVEIKLLITTESFDKMKSREKILKYKDSEDLIWDALNKYFDIKKMEIHKAWIQKVPAQLHIEVSGSGRTIHEKNWDDRQMEG